MPQAAPKKKPSDVKRAAQKRTTATHRGMGLRAPRGRIRNGDDRLEDVGDDDREEERRIGSEGCARSLRLIAAAGLVGRLLFLYASRGWDVGGDGYAYQIEAKRLASEHIIQGSLHPPAWTFFMAVPPALSLDGLGYQQVMTAIIGTTTIVVTGLAGRKAFRPRIGLIAAGLAAVYANRLRRGIGLYADPTIIYGLKISGTWDGDLCRRDLETDGPWNSQLGPGLPPGPIASPGLASLLAAARPADVDYLYFVSRNDGSHAFSETLAEHNRNVEQWQRRFFRDRKR